jgi:hypothetical protein
MIYCNGMMARLSRALRRPDWPLLLQAYAALLGVELGVRFLGILPVWRVIQAQYRRPRRRPLPLTEVRHLHQIVQRAARRHLYAMRCLPQSLALAWLLARRGISVELRLGVRQDNGTLLAHAWLEADGRPLDVGATTAQPFRPLDRGAITLRTAR